MYERISIRAAAALFSVLLIPPVAPAATGPARGDQVLTVNSTADSVGDDGACTLREAIVAANDNAASGASAGECIAGQPYDPIDPTTRDFITFTIPGDPAGDAHVIQPATELPAITEAVAIDGTGEPGAGCSSWPPTLLIELDGSLTTDSDYGLTITGSDTTIRGLVINRFGQDGVHITGGASGVRVQCNFIGTDPTGTTGLGNYGGVMIDSASSDNFVGTDGDGVDDELEGNLISGNEDVARNGRRGVSIVTGSNRNRVSGNLIGTDITGSFAIGNWVGVKLESSDFNVIGTDGDGISDDLEGNVVSGNRWEGMDVRHADSNTVTGNLIGTDITGMIALPNNIAGIRLGGTSSNNTIGTNADGVSDDLERNLVAGNNSHGIRLVAATNINNRISGNWIGLASDGATPLGNSKTGVLISGGSDNLVGIDPSGLPTVGANLIAYNSNSGIAVINGGTGNRLSGNSVWSNGALGIDLEGDDVTANDPGDADTGSNGLQNFPELTSVVTDATSVVVAGSLDSAASTQFAVEIFVNTSADSSGYGEAELLLGSTDLTTGAAGTVTFSLSLPAVAPSSWLTATATDPNGNTSELSLAVQPTLASIDLGVAIDDGVLAAVPGESVTITAMAANLGSFDATGVAVTTAFPVQSTCSWTSQASPGANGNGSGSGDISETLGLASGSSVTYTAVCAIEPGAVGSFESTTSISSTYPDPVSGNDSASDVNTALTPVCDLEISKDDGRDVLLPGDAFAYEIVTRNRGPSDVTSAAVTDIVPALLSGCNWLCQAEAGASCSPAPTDDLSDLVNLEAGAAATYTGSCTMGGSTTATVVSNTATIAAPVDTVDPDLGDNSATDENLGPHIFSDGFESGTTPWSGLLHPLALALSRSDQRLRDPTSPTATPSSSTR